MQRCARSSVKRPRIYLEVRFDLIAQSSEIVSGNAQIIITIEDTLDRSLSYPVGTALVT